jgi:aryl-alcohol dehydrogenase-like predicted oxidoreductase
VRYRTLGRTGLEVSEIGFGCGPTAGLIVRGDRETRKRAVARALELGINYFDTAPIYGDTASESHLGETLDDLSASPVVATKVALQPADMDDIAAATIRSVEASLARLRRDFVEVVQLHNRVAARRAPKPDIGVGAQLTVEDVLGPGGVLDGFETLRERGVVKFFGCCSYGGETPAIERLIDSGRFDAMLVHYSLLNPTAWRGVSAAGLRSYGGVGARAAQRGMGLIVLRALDGGKLFGREGELGFLTEDGSQTLAQAGIRFALANAQASTVLVGFSSVDHIEEAAAASAMGPLTPDALARAEALYS